MHRYSLFTSIHAHSVISLGCWSLGRGIRATYNQYYVKLC
ncbi:major virion structural protein [Pseudomonas phage phiPto-bp6g]|nr:major virion structural protein [Pseudomonas phage phiPto-bp6g]